MILNLTSGCILTGDIEIDVPEQVPAIVVEGYLTPEFPSEISVAKNILMDDELIFQSVWGAKVSITDKEDTLDLLNIFYRNKNRNLLVNYVNQSSPGTLKGQVLYLSVITIEGDTLTGKTEIVPPVEILNAEIENNLMNISLEIKNGEFSGYLRIDITGYKNNEPTASSQRFLDLSALPLSAVRLPLTEKITESDSLIVKCFHITEEYYNYSISISNAKDAYTDPFLTPEEIKSNIVNGIGIFTYYTTDSKTITLRNVKKIVL